MYDQLLKLQIRGIGYMKGYKKKLNDGEDKTLAQWIIENAENGWK